MKELREPFLED